ncbi:hypothetical protein [Dyadobacter luticola]|jgi:hypothetical protein|uniref:Uncharacterized protein n=1 Tax=Dyadobacter luticola TaxID=1979387 RepID=A0A5R9KMV2_9BACT|nr:hypothetical protein [Dyadobacter luticola]TLU97366.1 hypothetical protein FEN17_26650 [Dyadobacter luticola]
MDKKYVLQAFEMKLKGRFDLLARYYGDYLFDIPAQIMIRQVKDELDIEITEDAIYNLKRRRKSKQAAQLAPLVAAPGLPVTRPLNQVVVPPAPPEQDLGTIIENATKEPKGKKDPGMDFTDF